MPSLAIYAWGNNKVGQCGLGNDNTEDRIWEPLQIEGLKEKEISVISAGQDHSIAVDRMFLLIFCH